MRIIYLLLIVFFFSNCSTSKKAMAKDDWKLSWSDEFNYNGLPDSTKWGYDKGGSGWGNNELQYYTVASLNNAEVSNGSLKIKALSQHIENGDYTSARIVTKGKAEFTYGKIEIRAKLPMGRGLWPAVWMLGTSSDNITSMLHSVAAPLDTGGFVCIYWVRWIRLLRDQSFTLRVEGRSTGIYITYSFL